MPFIHLGHLTNSIMIYNDTRVRVYYQKKTSGGETLIFSQHLTQPIDGLSLNNLFVNLSICLSICACLNNLCLSFIVNEFPEPEGTFQTDLPVYSSMAPRAIRGKYLSLALHKKVFSITCFSMFSRKHS